MSVQSDYSENEHRRDRSLGDLYKSIRDATVTQKAKGVLLSIGKMATVMERYAAEMAGEADLADEDSKTPFLIAMGGDFSVPGIPVGSVAVGLAAYLMDPGSMKRAFRNLREEAESDEQLQVFIKVANSIKTRFEAEEVEEFMDEALSDEKRQKAKEVVEAVQNDERP